MDVVSVNKADLSIAIPMLCSKLLTIMSMELNSTVAPQSPTCLEETTGSDPAAVNALN